jgi:predicted cobalt transporter CbtA
VEKRLIARGLFAGAVAAVLAFVFAGLCAEPVIGRAIAFEDGRTDAENAHGVHEHGAELFTRGVQANAGLGFGVLIFGVAMGALFAVLFSVVAARARSIGSQALSALLAAAAFGAVYLVPFVKYPPNPPAVGQADTIGARTGWYLVMVLVSVVLAIAGVWLARRLAARLGTSNGWLLAAGSYLVAITVVMVLLPAVNETPEPLRDASGAIIYPGFPADDLYEFRLVSLSTQLVLWVTIGVVFATLAGRLLGERAEGGRPSRTAA